MMNLSNALTLAIFDPSDHLKTILIKKVYEENILVATSSPYVNA